MRLASGRGFEAPRAIAQFETRIDMPKSLIISRARVAEDG